MGYVTRDIASQIRVKLTPQEQTRLASARPVNPEAHELYLKGRLPKSRKQLSTGTGRARSGNSNKQLT
jgi:hypothetical protein